MFCAAIDEAGQRELRQNSRSIPTNPHHGCGWYADLDSEVVLDIQWTKISAQNVPLTPSSRRLSLQLSAPGRYGYPEIKGWSVFAFAGDPAAKIIGNRPIINHDIGSPASFTIAKQWMDDCTSNHSKCPDPKPGKPVMLPSRLIQVSSLGEPEFASLRKTQGQRGYYCALSYCWGMDQPFKTKIDRYNEYIDKLPYKKLPRTITDAFEVARNLGLQYIWIDSLCIIQDDTNDVSREINEMKRIYENAMVTISVATPSQCNEGFLYKRQKIYELPNGPSRLPIRLDKDTTGTVLLAGVNSEEWEKATEPKRKASINHRAWTLQESVLATRLLIFTDANMVWKCQDGFQPDFESAPPGAYIELDWSRHGRWLAWAESIGYKFIPGWVGFSSRPRASISATDHNWVEWWFMLENYTAREVSKATDRLSAISAIAESFAPFLGGKEGYRAGLWMNYLVFDLLWHTPSHRLIESRLIDPRVPSWSWAAAKGPVRFEWGDDLKPHATVIECSTTLEFNEASFGAVTSGKLHINGIVAEVSIDMIQRELLDKERKVIGDAKFEIDGGFQQWTSSHENGQIVPAWCLIAAARHYRVGQSSETIEEKKACAVLLIGSKSHFNCYRRVGYAKFTLPSWWEQLERTTIIMV
ncbi:heterokaryon incompatibility protein-domain-containing protein [Tricladium varicosporioides]|nr:heterokaryon incompatibility protein-domain-containing protein [Hymenoscyphus varicosporioides]